MKFEYRRLDVEQALMAASDRSSLEAALRSAGELQRDLKDPAILGHQMFSPGLDAAIPELASRLGLADRPRDKSNDRPCIIVTRTYDVGGHSKVAADIARLIGAEKSVMVHTDAPSEAGYEPSFRARRRTASRHDVPELTLHAASLVDKIFELYDLVAGLKPTRIFMLTHHFDMVAPIALWPFRSVVEYLHHADHLPTVAATLPWSAHVDLTWRCHGVCRDAGLDPIYAGMTVTAPAPDAQPARPAPPKPAGRLRVATCGHVHKYGGAGRYRWIDYAVAALRLPSAELIHFGYADEALQQEVRSGLIQAGLDPAAYVFAGATPSLAAALRAYEVDAYLSSYPEGGGKANLEAMSVGLAPIVLLDPDAPPLYRFDFPAPIWIKVESPNELSAAVSRAANAGPSQAAAHQRLIDGEMTRFAAYIRASRPDSPSVAQVPSAIEGTQGPEKVVFIGGAPRAGTTITHALLSTSLSVSEYRPETSFFRGLLQAYQNGRGAWPHHTSHFFDDLNQFQTLMRRTTDLSLHELWKHMDRPRILAIKDPMLTPYFPDLLALYPDVGRFVTVIRHPCDIVRSRQEVHDKSQAGRPFSKDDTASVSHELMHIYRTVLNTNFGGRHFAFRYEDITTARVQEGLAKFLNVEDLHARPMWGQPPDLGDDPWGSPKYHKAIDLEPRLSPLTPELGAVVRSICGPLMERFGYR